jgi:hypothetical protein
MNTKRLGWISVLAIIMVLAGIIGLQAFNVGNASAAPNTLEGAWTVNVSPDGGPSFVDLASFLSDGTANIIESDGVGIGVWEKLTGDNYAFTFLVFIKEGDAYLTAKVRSTVKLSADKEHYNGSYFFQIWGSDGGLIAEGSGTAEGIRQHVELMP